MTNFEISWATLWRIFFMLLLATALFLIRDIIAILFLAIVISSGLDGPVTFLERKKIPRVLSTLLIFLIALAILALILYTIIPISIVELTNLLKDINKLRVPVFGSLDVSQYIERLDRGLGGITDMLFSGGESFFNIIAKIFGNAVLVIATFVLSLYLTINRSGVEKFLRAILPIMHEETVIDIYLRTRKKLGLWFQGQIILMLIIGLITFLGLWILGVKYSLILGILAGLLEIVPIVGPIFAGTIAFLVAIPESLALGLYTALLFLIIHQAETHLFVPLVMKKMIGISPVVVVIALLAGYKIAGFPGIILAVPTAMVFQEIIRDWEKKKLKSQRLKLNRFQE